MPPHITILLIDNEQASLNSLDALQRDHGDVIKVLGHTDNFMDGVRAIQRTSPMVVILQVSELEKGVQEVRYILSTFHNVSVFVSADHEKADWVLGLMRAGAIEYLNHPLNTVDLATALQKIGRLYIPKPETHIKQGKIISVYNPAGGVGTTTIAVNLATCLANNGHTKVALVDLNLRSGDVSSFLDINPAYTLSSVTSNITRLDANFLMSVMLKHSAGMYVLTEPIDVDESSNITPEQLHRVLTYIAEAFEYVIIDVGGPLIDCNLAIFEVSDHILYAMNLSLPGLKNTKRYITGLERKGFRKGRVKLIINRYLPRSDIHVSDAEKILDWKVFLTIPNEYNDVAASINKGEPLVKLYPSSPVSKSIMQLAGMLKE